MLGGGDVKEIFRCIQVESKGSMTVTFSKEEYVKVVEEQNSLKIGENKITFQRANAKITSVVVKNLPYEIDEATVESMYAKFGRIMTIERDRFRSGEFKDICNGSWIIRLEMEKEIPNYCEWEGYTAVNLYRGMRKSCRKCGEAGHMAVECGNELCFNCRAPGHRARDCEEPCGACGEKGHLRASCRSRSFAAVAAGNGESESAPPAKEEKAKEVEREGRTPMQQEPETTETARKPKESAPARGRPNQRQEKKRAAKIPPETLTFLRAWLNEKLKESICIPTAEAEKRGLLPEDKVVRDMAEKHQRISFETNGEMVFVDPKKGSGVLPGLEHLTTKEENLVLYAYVGIK